MTAQQASADFTADNPVRVRRVNAAYLIGAKLCVAVRSTWEQLGVILTHQGFDRQSLPVALSLGEWAEPVVGRATDTGHCCPVRVTNTAHCSLAHVGLRGYPNMIHSMKGYPAWDLDFPATQSARSPLQAVR